MEEEKMYGSIRKNYSTARDTSSNSEKKSRFAWFKKKNKVIEQTQEVDDLQETRYIKVDEVRKAQDVVINKNVKTEEKSRNIINKNEFPVASVILTIVLTMMAMVLAFGGI